LWPSHTKFFEKESSMNKSLKLSYFNIKNRGEAPRLALVIGGIEFEDERIDHTADSWKQELKPLCPFNQLPALTIDGKIYAQSLSILRYCGKLAKLYPEDLEESLQVDMVLDHIEDMWRQVGGTMQLSPEQKTIKRAELQDEILPRMFKCLENVVGNEYCVGDKLSIADLLCYVFMNWLKMDIIDGIASKTVLSSFKRLNKIYENVDQNEKVVEWNNLH
jgi:glutathione S-transferase